MRRTTLISLAFFGLVLAIFFGLRYFDKQKTVESTPTPGLPQVFPLDLTSHRGLDIKTPFMSIRAKTDGNSWTLLEPNGSTSDTLPQLANEVLDLVILRKLDISVDEIGLTNPPRLEISLTGLDEQIYSLTIGSDTPTGTGTYARTSDGSVVMLRTAAVQAIEALILQVK